MASTTEQRKQELLAAVEQRIRDRCPADEQEFISTFVRRYYERVAADDLAEREAADLYGAALSHWHLARKRRRGQHRVHVYNPEPEQHGWESTHTIVQVACDDRPFLVDSVAMAMNRHALTVHLIIHPIIHVRRDEHGAIEAVDAEDGRPEAYMHFEVDRQSDPERLEALEQEVYQVLENVDQVVEDFQSMHQRMEEARQQLETHAPEGPDRDESIAFLEWLTADHFTFLGYRCYDLETRNGEDALTPVKGSGLGILRRASTKGPSDSFSALPEGVRALARSPEMLILTKSTHRATIHRPGYMDYVGVKRLDDNGKVIGEHRFLGLYTSAAYNRNPRAIPLLRRKIQTVLERADLPHPGHASKALINILETYPRDELFQIHPDTLYDIAMGILQLQERQRVRLFVRHDTYRRFVSCLVFVPRDRYNTDVRQRMQSMLENAFDAAHCEFTVNLSESVLARIHFILHVDQGAPLDQDADELERRLAHTIRAWSDDLQDALREYYGEARGNSLFERYGKSFGAAYREDTSARASAHDVERLEQLDADNDLNIVLYRPLEAPEDTVRLRLYHRGRSITLSDALPVLENMGVRVLDERPYRVQPRGRNAVEAWIHDFGLRYPGGDLDVEQLRGNVEQAFAAVWYRRADNDGFNHLVLAARLAWDEIVVLRAYSRYLRQAGTAYSQAYMEETLARNPRITRLLVRLFHNRFDPERHDAKRAARLAEQIERALHDVPSLDEDRMLRRLLAAMQATVRTNAYRRDAAGNRRDWLSLKLIPERIPEMPKPWPAYEIYVYSPRTEGVHLRGGKVARGGLRWSERKEDYRTEVLGLMKAQMVKNAVIVPVGAKGGFVAKQLPEERDAQPGEVESCYRIFIRALLDVTDNYAGDAVQPPADVIRHDDDDPYLVVAADKGTATFSDVANEIATEYGFWLGDAFASGGSNGYDHKKMAITARGAWVAVMRHFRELGHDIQSEPFSVVGVGDMSGDVFGNGMLLSDQIRLLAAFDHRHIFIDPNPDPAASFAERQRLFQKPRSSWDDYNRKLLSKGGGIYPRSAKSIELSAAARKALDIEARQVTPNELMYAILRAPVDLFWNGGIGTYIKSSLEGHLDVGDRANDAIRVDARDMRCRVVGEGGNLGVTQLGRIEFARHGGRINTDAIDNAGGVSCSDHEVNIKILLNEEVEKGDLTDKQRSNLLASMSDGVAQLVLEDNYRQTEALSTMEYRAAELLGEHGRQIRALEHAGELDRQLEGLPDDAEMEERAQAGEGLTRPELAVLLAHAKLAGFRSVVQSDLVDDQGLQEVLVRYFPEQLQSDSHRAYMRGHRLRREIIATQITNDMLNRMGGGFLYRLEDKTGVPAGDVARAYFAARQIHGLEALWDALDAQDNRIPAGLQQTIRLDIVRLAERTALWLLRNLRAELSSPEVTDRLAAMTGTLGDQLDSLLPEPDQAALGEQIEALTGQGVPDDLAARVARLEPLSAALDISMIAEDTGRPPERAAAVYFQLGRSLNLRWLEKTIRDLETANAWEERCRVGLEDDFALYLRLLTTSVLYHDTLDDTPADRVAAWQDGIAGPVERLRQTLGDIGTGGRPDLAMLTVAVQDLKNVAVLSGRHQMVDSAQA
ncbi:NAD-glutamate dehydrogenase [Aquisalimonas lutea]|uniref:NAD-glutamate dehydrogenase n=1 Tax=Aquisalimonas lutea TaxID=1327750 RepID=UPI0025B5EFEF|nr:NAD-glutamate dehydrogenase [Aquisalimonas lutea]MDN3516680.1 NAD-glutamate dehydrogenase [Aquisalimonas lutea]